MASTLVHYLSLLLITLTLGNLAIAPGVDASSAATSKASDLPAYATGKVAQQTQPVRIVRIYGRRQLEAGEAENFRVQVSDYAARPIVYRWSLGDGTLAEGNNVAHRYARPGRYLLIVTARNARGADTDSMYVTVRPSSRPVAARDESNATATAGSAPPGESNQSVSAVETASAASPPPQTSGGGVRRAPAIDWNRGGFTLLAATFTEREAAEAHALKLRRAGYQTGIYVDSQPGLSDAFRVVVGQYATEEAAVEGRRRMLRSGAKGAWMVVTLDGR